MEYAINGLAKMSGISTRTLRYYEEIGLLKPARVNSNNYRIYGEKEVDNLQQILFYRELSVPLNEIKLLLSAPDYDREQALESHLTALTEKQERLNLLIQNVTQTINSMKGEITMNDTEKFEGFKKNLIDENEQKYGAEVRGKYGDAAIDGSNAKLMGLSKERYDEVQQLSLQINETLKLAIEMGDPASEPAQKACDLHRQWLCFFWQDGVYSKETHISIAEMYVADERFKAYYDKIADGAAEFLCEAIKVYCA